MFLETSSKRESIEIVIAEIDYLNHIQRTFPDLNIQHVQVNREGMANISIIINQERVFRFPREEWGVDLLRNEANALDLVRKYVDIPVPIRTATNRMRWCSTPSSQVNHC